MSDAPMTVSEWHSLLGLLCQLTQGTEDWNEVADRFKACATLHTCKDPFDSICALGNILAMFTEPLDELFHIPEKHGWTKDEIVAFRGGMN